MSCCWFWQNKTAKGEEWDIRVILSFKSMTLSEKSLYVLRCCDCISFLVSFTGDSTKWLVVFWITSLTWYIRIKNLLDYHCMVSLKKEKNSKQMLTVNMPKCGLSDGHEYYRHEILQIISKMTDFCESPQCLLHLVPWCHRKEFYGDFILLCLCRLLSIEMMSHDAWCE